MSSKTLRRVLGVLAVFTAVFAVLSVKTQAATNEDVKPIVYDAEYYITTAKDLQDAYIREDGSVDEEGLYGQFVVYGIAEGRKGSPSFDIKYYMEANPDLAKEFGATNYARGYQHFLEFGLYEGRTGCNLYDNASYKAYNPDLVTAYGNANEMYYVHFVLFGQGEGRKACDWFDVKCYVNSNSDLKNTFGTDWKAGYKHYAFFGNSENRIVAHTWEDGVCATCGEKQAPTEHVHAYVVNEEESIPATCTTTGRKVEVCSCGDRKETVVPALGHDFSVEATDEQLSKLNLHRATCEEAGTKAMTCSHGCGELSGITGEEALGHEWGGFRELTADEKKEKAFTGKLYVKECARCGAKTGMTLEEAFEDPSVAELEVDASDESNKTAFAKIANLVVPAGTTRTVTNQSLTLLDKKGTELVVKGSLYITNLVAKSGVNGNTKVTLDGGTVTMLVDNETKLKNAVGAAYISAIELTSDISNFASSATVDLKAASDKTIDLGGYTLTGTGSTETNPVIKVENSDYTLTMEHGTITSSTVNNLLLIEGNLVMEDVVLTNSKEQAIDIISGAMVTLKDCTVQGKVKAIRAAGDLTVEDCTIKSSEGYGIYAKGPNGNKDKVTVNLNNVNINCAQYCVATNATQDNVDLTLTNVTAYSNNNTHSAVYLPAKGNTVISGGSFTGATAVECVASNLEIKDGAKLSGTKIPYATDAHNQTGGSYATGSALILTSRGGGYSIDRDVITVKISADVEFKYSAPDPAFNVEFIENQRDTEGASYDITWEGHVWSDVHHDVSNNLTINFVKFNGDTVLSK